MRNDLTEIKDNAASFPTQKDITQLTKEIARYRNLILLLLIIILFVMSGGFLIVSRLS